MYGSCEKIIEDEQSTDIVGTLQKMQSGRHERNLIDKFKAEASLKMTSHIIKQIKNNAT